jgi:alanine racemase
LEIEVDPDMYFMLEEMVENPEDVPLLAEKTVMKVVFDEFNLLKLIETDPDWMVKGEVRVENAFKRLGIDQKEYMRRKVEKAISHLKALVSFI